MKLRQLIFALLALLALAACGKKQAAAPQLKIEAQPVTVEELALRELEDFITVSGKLEGITDITMSSEASGRVIEVYKKLGDSVKRGERIGRLDSDVYQYRYDQAEATLASAQSAYDNARKNLSYAEASLQKGLISQAEYNTAQSAYKGAKAALDGAKAGLESSRSGVSGSYFTAPEAGLISNLYISAGQVIAPGAPVASITNASRLILKTGVGESQITKLRKGQRAQITHPGLDYPLSGTVRGFGIRPLSGFANYPVEIELANPQGLLPGMIVTAKVLTERYTGLLFTELTNFSNEFGKTYAFVVDADNKAHRRAVSLGRIIGEYVLIQSGLEPGEVIVTSGAENLEEGSLVEIRK